MHVVVCIMCTCVCIVYVCIVLCVHMCVLYMQRVCVHVHAHTPIACTCACVCSYMAEVSNSGRGPGKMLSTLSGGNRVLSDHNVLLEAECGGELLKHLRGRLIDWPQCLELGSWSKACERCWGKRTLEHKMQAQDRSA